MHLKNKEFYYDSIYIGKDDGVLSRELRQISKISKNIINDKKNYFNLFELYFNEYSQEYMPDISCDSQKVEIRFKLKCNKDQFEKIKNVNNKRVNVIYSCSKKDNSCDYLVGPRLLDMDIQVNHDDIKDDMIVDIYGVYDRINNYFI